MIACLVTRPRARAKPCPIVLTATEAVSMTPRVAARARHAALARDPPPGITNANLHSVMPSPPSEGCSGTRRVFQCLGSPRTMWKFQPPSWKDSPTRYATRRKIPKVELSSWRKLTSGAFPRNSIFDAARTRSRAAVRSSPARRNASDESLCNISSEARASSRSNAGILYR